APTSRSRVTSAALAAARPDARFLPRAPRRLDARVFFSPRSRPGPRGFPRPAARDSATSLTAKPVDRRVQLAMEMADGSFETSELEELVRAARETALDRARHRLVFERAGGDQCAAAFERRLRLGVRRVAVRQRVVDPAR